MGIRRLVQVLLLLPVAACCWLLLPTAVGGPTSYVLVEGQSMEPLLFTGDLAVASRLPDHDAGDLTVFDIGSNQLVIHRLVGRAPNGEWITQGDNKPAPDPWTVPDSAILGTYVFGIDGAGEKIAWLKARPLAVALFAGLLVMASYLPFSRVLPRRWRKTAPKTDEGASGDSNEWSVIVLAFAGAFACVIALMTMARQDAIGSPLGLVVLVLTLVSGTAGLVLLVSRITQRRRENGVDSVSGGPDLKRVDDEVCSLTSLASPAGATSERDTSLMGLGSAVELSGLFVAGPRAIEPAVASSDAPTASDAVTETKAIQAAGPEPAPEARPIPTPWPRARSTPLPAPILDTDLTEEVLLVGSSDIGIAVPDQAASVPAHSSEEVPVHAVAALMPKVRSATGQDGRLPVAGAAAESHHAGMTDRPEVASSTDSTDSIDSLAPVGVQPSVAVGRMKPKQMKRLRAEQVRVLPVAAIRQIRPGGARVLRPKTVAALSPEQMSVLRPASVRELKPAAIARLEPKQVAAFRPTVFGRMKPEQYAMLRAKQVRVLQVSGIRQIPPAGLRAMSPKAVAALSPEQISALSSAAVGALKPAQLRRFSPDQVAALTPRQLAALTPRKRDLLGPKSVA